jgi:hypothetical protein
LLIDPEVQIEQDIIKRLWGRHSDQARRPFYLLENHGPGDDGSDSLGPDAPELIAESMRCFRLIPIRNGRTIGSDADDSDGPFPFWLDRALKKITVSTAWDDKYSL